MDLAGILSTSRVASVDTWRANDAPVVVQVVTVALFAALTAAGAQVRLYLWEVPFTLQTLAVYGSGLFLGMRNGFLAQLLYLVVGLVLPVYAGGQMGPAYLFSAASAGYLVAFPLVAALVGRLSERWNSLAGATLALLCGSALLFAAGVVWLHVAAGHASWWESLDKGWLRFIPADLAKVFATGALYTGARRLFPA